MCVTLGVIGILLDLFRLSAGGPSMYCVRWSNEAATVHADITADHRDVPAFLELLNFGKGLVSSADMHVTPSPRRSVFALSFWPSFLLKSSRFPWFVHVLLGNGTLGRRVAPQSSQYAYP